MTTIFEDHFQDSLLNPNIWIVNKVGFITGSPIPAMKVYHITDAEPNLFIDGNSKGNQHEAKLNIPDNCDISFEVAISDPIATAGGQVGLAIVKAGIEGLPNDEDNKMLLFVGQQDRDRAAAVPENCIISSHSISLLSSDYVYSGSSSMVIKGLNSTIPEGTTYVIQKRGNSYTVVANNQPVCSTSFGGNVKISICAAALDPCLWFMEWAELQNVIVEAI